MAVLRYNGPNDIRELWGVAFPKGARVETNDPELVRKALCLEGFERLDVEPVSKPDPDDYAPVEDTPAELPKVPEVAPGTVPENWRDMHWRSRAKLAKELTGRDDITTAEVADAVIEGLLEPR